MHKKITKNLKTITPNKNIKIYYFKSKYIILKMLYMNTRIINNFLKIKLINFIIKNTCINLR